MAGSSETGVLLASLLEARVKAEQIIIIIIIIYLVFQRSTKVDIELFNIYNNKQYRMSLYNIIHIIIKVMVNTASE